MKGSAFVSMFRIQWNASRSRSDRDFFDSYDFFKIQYVFGYYCCIPEYCTRKELERVVDDILSKAIAFYLRALDIDKPGWFCIEFDSIMRNAEIQVKGGDCSIYIEIEPCKELPEYDR